MSRHIRPSAEELEISLIGPGRGESIILHLGGDEWAIIDSCVPRGTATPAALEYLSLLGVDVSNRVRLVVATHWHDDHIRGLASILSATPNSRFSCSLALQNDQFFTLVGIAADSPGSASGINELNAVLAVLEKRRANGFPAPVTTPQYAIERRELLRLDQPERPFPIRLCALSPSDRSIERTLQEIATLIPSAGATLSLAPESLNHTSVVLWLEAGGHRVLLGADLQNSNDDGRGWTAVLAAHQDHVRGAVFKVPHHGSENADHDGVWSEMLFGSVIAIVAPYSGGKWLPSNSDRARLLKRTPNLYCTAQQPSAAPKREPLVEKKIREAVKRRKTIVGPPGHVRIRWRVGEADRTPLVEVFNGAYQITPESKAPAA